MWVCVWGARCVPPIMMYYMWCAYIRGTWCIHDGALAHTIALTRSVFYETTIGILKPS